MNHIQTEAWSTTHDSYGALSHPRSYALQTTRRQPVSLARLRLIFDRVRSGSIKLVQYSTRLQLDPVSAKSASSELQRVLPGGARITR